MWGTSSLCENVTVLSARNLGNPEHHDGVRNELAARAASKGFSLQEKPLSDLHELAAKPDRATLLARIRDDLEGAGPLSLDDILEARDADRR